MPSASGEVLLADSKSWIGVSRLSAAHVGQFADIVERLVDVGHHDTNLPSPAVTLGQQQKVIVVLVFPQTPVSTCANGPVMNAMCVHVVSNQPCGTFGDEAFKRFEGRSDVIVTVDALADIVQ